MCLDLRCDRRDAVVFLSFAGPCFIALSMGYFLIFLRGRPTSVAAALTASALGAMCLAGIGRLRELAVVWRQILALAAPALKGWGKVFLAITAALVLMQAAQAALEK